MPINDMVYVKEIITREGIIPDELKNIKKLISSYLEDARIKINQSRVLSTGEAIYEVKLNKKLKTNDVELINFNLKSLGLEAKLEDPKIIIISEMFSKELTEDDEKILLKHINENLTYKYGIIIDFNELRQKGIKQLKDELWGHGGIKLIDISIKNYGIRAYLNNRLSKSEINELNEILANVYSTFKEVIYKR